jgi:hypothetical protein
MGSVDITEGIPKQGLFSGIYTAVFLITSSSIGIILPELRALSVAAADMDPRATRIVRAAVHMSQKTQGSE